MKPTPPQGFPARLLLLGVLLLNACGDESSAPPAAPKGTTGPRVAEVRAGRPTASLSKEASASGETPATVATLGNRLAAALAETDPVRRGQAVEAVAWEAAGAEPEVFRAAFRELAPGSPEDRRLLAHGAQLLAETDPDAALTLALSLGDSVEMAEVAGGIAVALAEADPRQSAEIVSALGDEGVQARAAVQVLQRWAATEPAQAAAWVMVFPEGAARSDGLRAVVQTWLNQDPAGLSTWLGSDAAAPLHAEALAALADLIRQQPDELRVRSLARFPGVVLPALPESAPATGGK